MSDSAAVILVIVAVVLVVAVVALMLMRTRGNERRAHQAAELRDEAAAKAVDVEQARGQAEIAEARAAEARQHLAQVEAQQEDTLREADRLDPSVKHTSSDYRPTGTPRSDPR